MPYFGVRSVPSSLSRDTPASSTFVSHGLAPGVGRDQVECHASCSMRREPLKQTRRQVALGQLQDEVPGMPDQASAGFEEARLEAGEGPALDGPGGGRATAADSRGCTR